MAKLGINTGSTPDAGDGDSLLVGAIKINSNFDELYNVLGDGTNVSNTIGYASTSGISTLSQGLSGTPNITVGIVTASFVNVTGSGTSTTQLRVTGVSTLSTTNISGDLTFTGSNDIYLKDNGVANFGNSNDLQIYHNGSFSVIKDDGTGGLVVYSDGVGIGTENITNTLTVAGSGTSTSQLYVTGVSTFFGNATFKGSVFGDTIITDGSIYSNTGFTTFAINVARGVDFKDQGGLGKVRISGDQGVGNGRIGFYNSSNNLVSTWDTNLFNGSIDIYNYTNSGTQNITISAGSSVVLQHGGTNTKLQTLGVGVTVTGTTFTNQLSVSGVSTLGSLSINSSTITPSTTLTVAGNLFVNDDLTVNAGYPGIGAVIQGSTYGGQSTGFYRARVDDLSYGTKTEAMVIGRFQNLSAYTLYNDGSILTNGDVSLVNGASLNVSGIASASSFSGSGAGLTSIPAAQLTGALPAIDGSALINVTASGTGIIIADDGTPVGTAGTIDFGTGIIVSPVSAGIVTVTSTGGGGGESYWVSTNVGIHTLSSVGVGTTNPTSALTVVGSGASLSQLYVAGVSTFAVLNNANNVIINPNSYDPGIYWSDSNGLYLGFTPSISVNGSTGDVSISGGSGNLQLLAPNNSNKDVIIKAGAFNPTAIHCRGNAEVELYYQGNQKFETLGTGVTVTGTTFTNDLSVSGIATINGLTIQTGSGTFTATAGIGYTADSYAVSDFVNAEYTLFFQHSTGIQSQKVLVMDDGTTAYSQEYGIMSSNDLLVSVGATVNSGNVELWWTPETGISGIVTYRYTRETMI